MEKSLILEEMGLGEKLMMRMAVSAVEMLVSYSALPYPLYPNYKYLSGLAILPSIADAAAVAGDERYTLDESAPILPIKFLEDEEIHISSSPRAPRCVPTQAPHVAFVNTAPDSIYTSTYPRRIASSYSLTEAGVTIHLVFLWTFLPLRIRAAISKSSILPFVAEPMNAWSISMPAISFADRTASG